MMGRREIGMLMALSVDRLNRKLEDFGNLLELAAQTGTLLCIGGVVYGPAGDSDLLPAPSRRIADRARLRSGAATHYALVVSRGGEPGIQGV